MDASPLQPQVPRAIEATEDNRLVPSVVLTGHGRMKRIKVMNTPLPHALKDDHVEVEVFYCGLNFTDNYLRLGIIRSEAFPVVMGSECCGIVRRVGAAVDDLEAGRKVLCLWLQGGLFRRVVQVPRGHCFALPASATLKHAAALGLDCLVAYLCLFDLGRLRKAGVVFMQSLAGGVGTAVAQLARTVPLATVLGTASESKHDQLWRLGVNGVYSHEEDYVERISSLYPEGVDVAIVRSGGAETEKFLRLLKPCGRLITIGSDSTATYPRTITMTLQRPTWDTKYVSSAELVNKNVIVAGLNVGDMIKNHSYDVQIMLDNVFDLYFQEKIKPQIHSVLPFEKMTDGLELLCRRENFGKVLLVVQDELDQPVAFGWRVPSPPKPIPGAVTWDRLQRRVEAKVICKRKLKYWARQAEMAAAGALDETEEENAGDKGKDDDDDSMFTELEASVAAEMVKAISESEAEGNASF
ncbi:synaptic vesicle membrane protein VAT-1 homolog [Schistocerca gregaria]|uniref:synaptic vesicle membrane protein VAT-1 homolog n=1 Tax=Schistocerca gregaria TaxID=7010 RepID=UPI00211EA900|nr:synaptic vesicle membrane protein VAT-1 homolog [Schistocerca gregaria]